MDPVITITVCREDLETLGYDGSQISDDTLQSIASMLEEALNEEFYTSLARVAKLFDLPKINK